MILLLYIFVFSVACLWRVYRVTGRHLKVRHEDGGHSYLECISSIRRGKITVFLGVDVGESAPFIVRREHWIHRLSKLLCLTKEIELGHKEVDKKIFFSTQNTEGIATYFSKPQVVEALKKLFFNYSIVGLQCHGKRLWISCPYINKNDYTQSFIQERVKQLRVIAAWLPVETNKTLETNPGYFTQSRISMAFMVIHMALFIFGFFALFGMAAESTAIIDTGHLIDIQLRYIFLTGLIWLTAIIVLLIGSSWFPLVLLDFLLVGVVGLVFSVAPIVREANIELDNGAPTYYESKVTTKSCSMTCSSFNRKRKKSTTHSLTEDQCLGPAMRMSTQHTFEETVDFKCGIEASFAYTLELDNWKKPRGEKFSFSTTSALYDTIMVGDLMCIPSHPGALNMEWVYTDQIQAVK